MQSFASEIRKNQESLRILSSHVIINKYIIKKTKRISYSIITLGKSIKEEYKLFAINNKKYLYNYTWYSLVQGLKDRLKCKGLGETLVIILKLTADTLLKNIILFINNYFTYIELALALRDRGITIYKTIKPGRKDLLKLLIKIKQQFARDIPHGVLAVIIQKDVLLVAWQNNNLILDLITAYRVKEINNSISKKRKRFNKTSINTRIILPAFRENNKDISKKEIKVPRLFYYYNKYISEVNRFNALIAIYTFQRAYNRN